MKQSTFNSILSFLIGTSWAFILIGAWGVFKLFYFLGLGPALVLAIFFIFFGLFGVLLLETILIYRQRHDEQRKQTELLKEIKSLLEKSD